eukprot:g995.t1
MIVDAHQHFWKIDRGDYFWMDDSVAEIRRDILPSDLRPHTEACKVRATIAVQAAPTVAETEFLLQLAGSDALIAGVVGWVDLERERAVDDLRKLAANPLFKGVRPMLQDIADTNWILKPAVLTNLAIVADMGLSLDALITPRHFSAISEVAAAQPDLRIVIDHCAKPVFDGADPGDSWRDEMTRLASHPQVFCKLSGLANEHGPGWSAERLQPVFDHVISAFGPERVMWGSDWPVLDLAGDYVAWFKTAQTLAEKLSVPEKQLFFSGTAERFYRLEQ